MIGRKYQAVNYIQYSLAIIPAAEQGPLYSLQHLSFNSSHLPSRWKDTDSPGQPPPFRSILRAPIIIDQYLSWWSCSPQLYRSLSSVRMVSPHHRGPSTNHSHSRRSSLPRGLVKYQPLHRNYHCLPPILRRCPLLVPVHTVSSVVCLPSLRLATTVFGSQTETLWSAPRMIWTGVSQY